jgi:putative ABC transport system permease protein
MSLLAVDTLQNILEQGLIYSAAVMAVYLTSRVIAFDDLTIEGSFGVGGAVMAVGVVTGLPIAIVFALALAAGAVSGLATALLHDKLKMNNLLCGIVVTTALFSVCLNLAGANLSLPAHAVGISLPLLVAITVAMLGAVLLLMRSELGSLLRVLGSNPRLLVLLGKNASAYRMLALACANALTAVAGALLVKWTGYFSVFGNVGTMVIALASLMIGEALSRRLALAVLGGAICYQLVFACVLEFELSPSWNNLMKAGLIAGLMLMRRMHAYA